MPRRAPPAPAAQLGLDLPEEGRTWPSHRRFPYNFGGKTVGGQLLADLTTGEDILLVAGYASLEELLDLFDAVRRAGVARDGGGPRLRVLLGVEPFQGARPLRTHLTIHQGIFDYWLERGISLLRSPEVFGALALLDAGRLEVRASGSSRVHAKLYQTPSAVTIGSSNFTEPGLRRNQEANVRFDVGSEPTRHGEASQLGEAVWDLGSDFQQGFRDLLDSLLQKVTWKEALARACAELLEGRWAGGIEAVSGEAARPLWPSQEQGIAQALWVLENAGSVLVADATGSGKTRLGASLLRAVQDRNWRTGRSRGRAPVLVCPPILRTGWRREFARIGGGVTVFSHGVLSAKSSERRPELEESLGHAQVLAVDEAHNFLNPGSQRSRMLYGNVADHVVLLTATPINRGASDLLSMVDLLGADNFEEAVLEVLARLGRRRGSRKGVGPSDAETELIRAALQHFVVRRTKADLNDLIDAEPDRYVNALGERCRFPEHVPVVFPRNPPLGDRGRAGGIREKAKNLKGLINFQKALELPVALRAEGMTEERFLAMRREGSAALAAYRIRSSLRSSRIALVEHIRGTKQALSAFDLRDAKPTKSPGIVETLRRLRGSPPKNKLGIDVPDWLCDPVAHARAIDHEIATYEDIARLADQMSDHREVANARYLMDLLDRHERVLAFDNHLISLYALERKLRDLGAPNVALATGEGGIGRRRKFSQRFALGAEEKGLIGLCSDALAEGLNLQGASAVVHLDLPSVIRVLEQRIGRVDRMDTSFETIEVHWPQEPREFSLASEERLFWRLREVEDLLGSNVRVPEDMDRRPTAGDAELPLEEIINQVERVRPREVAEALPDVFTEVRALVHGEAALVAPGIYEALKRSHARVLSSVAVVRSARPWVFLAIGGADRSAPRWALVDLDPAAPAGPTVAVDAVARELRVRLGGGGPDVEFSAQAAEQLTRAIRALATHELLLLPKRKQRALDEMKWVLRRYRKAARSTDDVGRLEVVTSLLDLLEDTANRALDYGGVADWWLELVRPVWYAHLVSPRVKRPARLRHIRSKLLSDPITTEGLGSLSALDLEAVPLERRVVACVVGVSEVEGA